MFKKEREEVDSDDEIMRIYSFESKMFPRFFMDFDMTSVVLKRDEVFFRITEPGLTGKPGTCSIESMDTPGRYLHCPDAQKKVFLLEHEEEEP